MDPIDRSQQPNSVNLAASQSEAGKDGSLQSHNSPQQSSPPARTPADPPRKDLSQKGLPEDKDVLRRLQERDEQALLLLYDKYQRLVYSLAIKIVRDEHEAEELVQEVFLQVWEKAALFNSERGAFESWLITLTHNRAIDLLRSKRYKQRAAEDRLDPLDLASISTESTTLKRTALQETIEFDERALVKQALSKISPEQRESLELAYYEGYSQSEIAEKLQVPLGTIKTRMRQGMIKLSGFLKELHSEIGKQ